MGSQGELVKVSTAIDVLFWLRLYINDIDVLSVVYKQCSENKPTGNIDKTKGLVNNYGEGVLQNGRGTREVFTPVIRGGGVAKNC